MAKHGYNILDSDIHGTRRPGVFDRHLPSNRISVDGRVVTTEPVSSVPLNRLYTLA